MYKPKATVFVVTLARSSRAFRCTWRTIFEIAHSRFCKRVQPQVLTVWRFRTVFSGDVQCLNHQFRRTCLGGLMLIAWFLRLPPFRLLHSCFRFQSKSFLLKFFPKLCLLLRFFQPVEFDSGQFLLQHFIPFFCRLVCCRRNTKLTQLTCKVTDCLRKCFDMKPQTQNRPGIPSRIYRAALSARLRTSSWFFCNHVNIAPGFVFDPCLEGIDHTFSPFQDLFFLSFGSMSKLWYSPGFLDREAFIPPHVCVCNKAIS